MIAAQLTQATPTQLAARNQRRAFEAKCAARAAALAAPPAPAVTWESVAPPAKPAPEVPAKYAFKELWFRMVDVDDPASIAAPGDKMALSMRQIKEAVCDYFPGVSMMDMIAARREAAVVRPRQIAMYLCKDMTAKSLPEIGRHFGNRDHTTVLHAVRKIKALRLVDPELCHDLALIVAFLERLT